MVLEVSWKSRESNGQFTPPAPLIVDQVQGAYPPYPPTQSANPQERLFVYVCVYTPANHHHFLSVAGSGAAAQPGLQQAATTDGAWNPLHDLNAGRKTWYNQYSI